MNRITFAVATALILGAITIALPKLKSNVKAKPVATTASPQISPDRCKNAKFQFKNNRYFGEMIRAQKIENHQKVKNKWRAELTNFSIGDCHNGLICTTQGDDLADSKGVEIDMVKLHFQWKGTAPGSKWSSTIVSRINQTAALHFLQLWTAYS